MRISKIEVFPMRAELKETFAFSQWSYSARETTLVAVETVDGLTGWGEGYGPARVVAPAIEHFLAPLVHGRDPRDVEELWRLMFVRGLDYGQKGVMLAGISAIDIALWDLKARAAGVPLYRLLGASETESIPCYATGFYFSDREPLETKFQREAERYLDMGFHAMKMKVGLGVDVDARLVETVRGVIGPGIRLMIDANHAYDPPAAIALGRKVEHHSISWFEEPVSPLDIDGYLEVKQRLAIPIAGGEAEYTRFGFRTPAAPPRARLCAAGLVRLRWHQRGDENRDTGLGVQHSRDAARLGVGHRAGRGAALLRRAATSSGEPHARGQIDRVRHDRKSPANGSR
jgi:D-galactarolactone cycloisomerase